MESTLNVRDGAINVPQLEGLPDHTGAAPPAPMEFFTAPPSEIGTVVSAESTLRPGRSHKSFVARLLTAAVVAAGLIVAVDWGTSQMRSRADRESLAIVAYVVAGILFFLILLATRFKAVCSYVGERGVARFTLSGSRQAQPKSEVLVFEQAEELHAGQTRHYHNGIYTGTTYDYYWNGPDGRRLFRLKGQHRGNKNLPKRGSPFHFANAAELAWSRHYLARADRQLQSEGSIAFPVDKSRVVRVGPGFMEFHFGEAPVRLTRDEFASVNLSGGQFSFKHADAKWYSRAGKYSFSYGRMANAKVFIIALEKLMGYRWGG